jgi:acetyl-CoA acetyltransferase
MTTINDVFIAGVAETPLGKVVDHSESSMAAVAAQEALREAGLGFKDVDGLFINYMGEESTVQIGEYFGIQPRYADSSDLGGAAFDAFIHHAMLAIAAGRCEVALIVFASRQRTKKSRVRSAPGADGSLTSQFEHPYGLAMPLGHFGLMAARYMHETGATSEHLAHVAVAAREWAALNPKAWSRDPITVDDVLASAPISDPLHKLDCCLVLDGGGAIVVTSAARAADAAKKPVRVLGAGESHTHWNITQMPDLTRTAGVTSGRDAFAMAGVTPSDIDVFEPYDASTLHVLLALEDLGFCGRGEAGPFVAEGNTKPGGRLPAQTSGGGLSYNHPGAFGVQLIVEAVRQLRGECGERQVPGAELACVHGMGGLLSVGATVVLGRD